MQWEKATRTDAEESSSPYGPYLRTGRGGAGNHIWQSDLEKKKNEDPEAGLPSTTEEVKKTSDTPALKSSSNQSGFVASGRGGAGNFAVTSSQIVTDPAAPKASTSPLSKQPVHTTPGLYVAPVVAPYRGRGGAGNFEASSAQAHLKAQEAEKGQQQKESEVRKAVVDDVETGLQKPPGAFIQVPEGRERE